MSFLRLSMHYARLIHNRYLHRFSANMICDLVEKQFLHWMQFHKSEAGSTLIDICREKLITNTKHDKCGWI